MTDRLVARPFESGWPFKREPNPQRSRFDSTWTQTKSLLFREVDMIATAGCEIVLQVDIRPKDFRRDGGIRADARPPGYHGVIVSFQSQYGPLRYASDKFIHSPWGSGRPVWQDNVRAVALGLEALRLVDRYGIARDGQQYKGWNELGSGMPMPAAMSYDEAKRFMETEADVLFSALFHADEVEAAFRTAAKRLHPDAGGSADDFRRLVEARDLLVAGR